jgi:hypothetical protein
VEETSSSSITTNTSKPTADPNALHDTLQRSSLHGDCESAKWMIGVGSIICLVIGFQIILLASGLSLAFSSIKHVFVLLLKVEEEQFAEGMGEGGGDWMVTGGSKGGGGGREAEGERS